MKSVTLLENVCTSKADNTRNRSDLNEAIIDASTVVVDHEVCSIAAGLIEPVADAEAAGTGVSTTRYNVMYIQFVSEVYEASDRGDAVESCVRTELEVVSTAAADHRIVTTDQGVSTRVTACIQDVAANSVSKFDCCCTARACSSKGRVGGAIGRQGQACRARAGKRIIDTRLNERATSMVFSDSVVGVADDVGIAATGAGVNQVCATGICTAVAEDITAAGTAVGDGIGAVIARQRLARSAREVQGIKMCTKREADGGIDRTRTMPVLSTRVHLQAP